MLGPGSIPSEGSNSVLTSHRERSIEVLLNKVVADCVQESQTLRCVGTLTP